MTSDGEKSFKAKLRAIAKEKNRDPADLWQNLTMGHLSKKRMASLRNSRFEHSTITYPCQPTILLKEDIVKLNNLIDREKFGHR